MAGVLPCTRERSSTQWCCQRSRILSPPRWKRSKSCRRRRRRFLLADSPRCTRTRQRRDLLKIEQGRKKRKHAVTPTHCDVIVGEMGTFILLSDCFVWCLHSQLSCISCLALLMNATLFNVYFCWINLNRFHKQNGLQTWSGNGVYLAAILKSFPSSKRLRDLDSCRWLVRFPGNCWLFQCTVHHLEEQYKRVYIYEMLYTTESVSACCFLC